MIKRRHSIFVFLFLLWAFASAADEGSGLTLMEWSTARDTVPLSMTMYSAATAVLNKKNSKYVSKKNQMHKKPNILFILVDDLGWKDINAYEKQDIDTPALDKLAREGMLFTHAYASAPVCSPSRAAALTGQYPARIGLTNHLSHHNYTPKDALWADAPSLSSLPSNALTFAEVLQKQGYRTGFFGKWHLSTSVKGAAAKGAADPSTSPDKQGFDRALGGGMYGGPPSWFSPYRNAYIRDGEPGEYLPERLASEVIQFISEDNSKPFIAVMWPFLVHSPLDTKKHLIEKYEKRKSQGRKIGKSPILAGMIEALDLAIAEVLQVLAERDLSDNTLVIFSSDNGGTVHSNNGGLRGTKGYLFEGGLRVPLIVRWPGEIAPGSVSDALVSNVDFFPTFLAAAGVDLSPYADNLDGVNLLPLLRGEAASRSGPIYFHYPNYAWHQKNRLGGAIIEGHYKLINWYDDDSVALYNLERDPGETTDLSQKEKALAARLTIQFRAWLKRLDAKMPIKQH